MSASVQRAAPQMVRRRRRPRHAHGENVAPVLHSASLIRPNESLWGRQTRAAQATAITCPVLSVLGSRTSRLFVEGHELLHEWFPPADIPHASHLLQMEASGPVAAAIAAFFSDALQT
jgi:pimeloyl-ACP methyl ester carboxylesterase